MEPLLYSGLALDRAAVLRRDPGAVAILSAAPRARLLPYWRGRSLVAEASAVWANGEALSRLIGAGDGVVFLGESEDAAWFTADLSNLPGDPDNGPDLGLPGSFVPLRQVGAALPTEQAALLAYARGILHWHSRHRHCGSCGAPTRAESGGHVRRCTAAECGLEHYPRTDPAIIVLVTDGDRCLLGRQRQWPPGMYSCLAGFVEPGESLEEATAREVQEETGIEIAGLRYQASQPWPFPSSLMVGFMAQAVGGELSVDHHELEDARWFRREEIAAWDGTYFLPRRDSIARWLVERWLLCP